MFGGVGYKALVYVNRQLCGQHVGGRTPFAIDISAAAKSGQDNELLIYNTGFGLVIAMPSMIFWRHFRATVDGLVVEMEQQAIRLVEVVHGDRR